MHLSGHLRFSFVLMRRENSEYWIFLAFKELINLEYIWNVTQSVLSQPPHLEFTRLLHYMTSLFELPRDKMRTNYSIRNNISSLVIIIEWAYPFRVKAFRWFNSHRNKYFGIHKKTKTKKILVCIKNIWMKPSYFRVQAFPSICVTYITLKYIGIHNDYPLL